MPLRLPDYYFRFQPTGGGGGRRVVYDDQGQLIEGATPSDSPGRGRNPVAPGPAQDPSLPPPADMSPWQTTAPDIPRYQTRSFANPPPTEPSFPYGPDMYRYPDYSNPPPQEQPYPFAPDVYRYPSEPNVFINTFPNPPPNEWMMPNYPGMWQYPDFSNPPPNESMMPTPVDTYRPGDLSNPPPNEAMMPTPVDTYRPGDLSNPAPNEAMLPTLEDTYYPATPTSRTPQSRTAQPSQPSPQPTPLLSARPPGTNQDVSAPEWGGWGMPMGYFPYSQNPLGSFGVHGMPSYFGGSQYFNTSPYGGQLVGPGLQPQSVPAPGGMGGIYGVTGDAQLPFGGGHNPYRAALAYGFPNYFAGISGGDITQAGGGRHEGSGSMATTSR